MPKVAKKAPVKKIEEPEEVIIPSKIKKVADLEVGDPIVFAADKEDDADTVPVVTEDGDDLTEEAEIDTEEINPFGDKWEE